MQLGSLSMVRTMLGEWGVRAELAYLRGSFLLGAWRVRDWLRTVADVASLAAELPTFSPSFFDRTLQVRCDWLGLADQALMRVGRKSYRAC